MIETKGSLGPSRPLTIGERLRIRMRMVEYAQMPDAVRRSAVRMVCCDPFTQRSMWTGTGKEALLIHIPKTGGTSIACALGLKAGHVPMTRFRVHSPERFASAYSFAFVRDPADRLYSSFNYLRAAIGLNASPDVRWAETHLSRYDDFESFVFALKDRATRRNIMRWPHFRPMHVWLCAPGSDTPQVNFIGRFETIAEDTAKLCDFLGVSVELPHTRIAKTYLEKTITPEMQDIIAGIYSKDAKIFGYD